MHIGALNSVNSELGAPFLSERIQAVNNRSVSLLSQKSWFWIYEIGAYMQIVAWRSCPKEVSGSRRLITET